MTIFHKEGLIVRKAGKRTCKTHRIKHSAPETIPAANIKNSSKQLAHHLSESICKGIFRKGQALPQIKFTCLSYHVSSITVSKAYRILEERGFISKVGKQFWVGGFTPWTIASRIKKAILFTRTHKETSDVYCSRPIALSFRAMETELRSCGISLEYAVLDELKNKIDTWRLEKSYPAGLIFYGLYSAEYSAVIPQISPLVMTSPNPKFTVLIDLVSIDGDTTIPPQLHAILNGNINTSQARSLALYAARELRRDVVIILNASAIRKNLISNFLRYYKYILEIRSSAEKFINVRFAIIADGDLLTKEELFSLIEKNSTPFDGKKWLDYLRGKYFRAHTEYPDGTSLNLTEFCTGYNDILTHYGTNVLWVCASDAIAINAIEALKLTKTRIPEDIAIITLENDPQNIHLGISACSPDWDRLGYLMAHAIVNDFPIKRSGRGFLRVPVPIIHRQTTL
jgi:hypothetical protein